MLVRRVLYLLREAVANVLTNRTTTVVAVATTARVAFDAAQLGREVERDFGHRGAGPCEVQGQDPDDIVRARGASGFTHLFNAMSGMHHRSPGMVGAALAHARHAEIIPDLLHVHPGAIRAARRAIVLGFAMAILAAVTFWVVQLSPAADGYEHGERHVWESDRSGYKLLSAVRALQMIGEYLDQA